MSRSFASGPGFPQAISVVDNITPVMSPPIIGLNYVYDSWGSNWDRAEGAKLHNLNNTVGGQYEYNIGVNLRTGGTGASSEIGVSTNPLYVRTTATATYSDSVSGSDWPFVYNANYVYDAVNSQWNRLRQAQSSYAAAGLAVTGIPVYAPYFQFDDTSTDLAAEDKFSPARITQYRAVHNNLRNASGTEIGTITTPLVAGARAATSNPTSSADAANTNRMVDKAGRSPSIGAHVRELVAHQLTTITNSTAETTIVTAAGANVFADITALIINTDSNADTTITIKDSTGGTTQLIYTLHNAGNNAGGLFIAFPTPVKQGTANNNWTATLSNNTSTVDIFVQYVKNL